jgi:serine/threonine protein kinase/tetratricopeptide (TPR) repeat protein
LVQDLTQLLPWVLLALVLVIVAAWLLGQVMSRPARKPTSLRTGSRSVVEQPRPQWAGKVLRGRWMVGNDLPAWHDRSGARAYFFFVDERDARDPVKGENVLKAIPLGGLGDESKTRQQVEQEVEIQLLAQRGAQSVVPILDHFSEDGYFCIVMPRMQTDAGEVLDVLAKRGRTLDPELVRRIGESVARALATMLSRGYIHRDVKPSNILLSPNPLELKPAEHYKVQAWLADFGLAKGRPDLNPAVSRVSRHPDSSVIPVGTVDYWAPEIIAERRHGPEADVFALGAVLYEHLTGHHFLAAVGGITSGMSERDVIWMLAKWTGAKGPLQELALGPEFAWLGRLVTAMLAVDPSDRPQAREVLEALERWRFGVDPRQRPAAEDVYKAIRGLSSNTGRRLTHGLLGVALLVTAIAVMLAVPWTRFVPGPVRSYDDDPSSSPATVNPSAGETPPVLANGSDPAGTPSSSPGRASANPSSATISSSVVAVAPAQVSASATGTLPKAATTAVPTTALSPASTATLPTQNDAHLAAGLPVLPGGTVPGSAGPGVSVPLAPPTPVSAAQTPSPEQQLAAAEDLMAAGDVVGALATLEPLRQSHPTTPGLDDALARAHVARGNVLLEQGDLDGAWARFDAALRTIANQPAALEGQKQVVLKKCWLRMEAAWGKDDDAAINALECVLQTDPGYGGNDVKGKLYAARIAKADHLLAAGDSVNGHHALLDALVLDESRIEARSRLNAFVPPETGVILPSSLWNSDEEAKLQEAESAFKQSPASLETRHRLADVLGTKGRRQVRAGAFRDAYFSILRALVLDTGVADFRDKLDYLAFNPAPAPTPTSTPIPQPVPQQPAPRQIAPQSAPAQTVPRQAAPQPATVQPVPTLRSVGTPD